MAAIQSGQRRDRIATVIRILLTPFSWLYCVFTSLRNAAYRFGLFRVERLEGKVISIGNLTTGGTGKTPLAQLIAGHFLKQRQLPGILTRGYGAAYRHSDLVFNSDRVERDSIDWLSDEVVLLATSLPGCWFGVGKDRLRNGGGLAARHAVRIFVLDDGFQHRQLHRDLNIVLIDALHPFGNGLCLPGGNLRESKQGLERADLIVITRCEAATPEQLKAVNDEVKGYCPAAGIVRMRTELKALRRLPDGRRLSPGDVQDRKLWLLSAIGNPASFASLLQSHGLSVRGHAIYPDHHRYGSHDLDQVAETAVGAGCDVIVTTEKDAVKLPAKLPGAVSWLVAEISFAFADNEAIFFAKLAEVTGC